MQTRTNIVISCAVGVAVLSILALRDSDRGVAMTIAEERIPAAEARQISQLVEQFQRQARARDSRDQKVRGTPNKFHGCVRANFSVVENLAPELSVGIFKPGARYPALIRFSSNADPHADGEPDVSRMAIKLLDIAGEKLDQSGIDDDAHDLILVSQPTFLFSDVETYSKAFNAFAADKTLQFFFNPLDPHISLFFNARQPPPNRAPLLETRWWSAVAYRYGDNRAVKYAARPCTKSKASSTEQPSDNDLHDQLKQQLRGGSGCFEFMLQFQTNAQNMPIEDPSVAWDEFLAPFEPVALLTIEAQSFDSDEQIEFCENLSYNPWRALAEHRPLGGINRARREIYAALARRRHSHNGDPGVEPRENRAFSQ